GIATVENGVLERRRSVGKLVNLSDELVQNPLKGRSGIGHTRWATHGAPIQANAHPHRSGPVCVVHNGIIENYRELRAQLEGQGYAFITETDTETIAVLTHKFIDEGNGPVEAAMAAIAQLKGAFALAFLFEGEEDLIVAARLGSPLAIGHGDGEMFVGSDALALAPMTNTITYLDEGDRAVLTRTCVEIFDATGNPASRAVEEVQASAASVDKGGYRHFMSKEINEQPKVLADTLGFYLPDGETITLPEPGLDFTQFDRVVMVACGTAYYACFVAKYWFEQISGLPVDVDVASEFRYREPPIGPRTLAILVSQSGETADTLAAQRYLKGKAAAVVAAVNVTHSSIARESDLVLPLMAGVEIGVASTKAFTCMLTVLAALALKAGFERGEIDGGALRASLEALRSVPGAISHALTLTEAVDGDISAELAEATDVLYLGRGAMYPLALEGALKLKEISYIHAEGYASGELKHGPIALVDPHTPVIVFAPHDKLFDKTMSNMQEVLARGGKVLLVTDHHGIEKAGDAVWKTIRMPDIDPLVAPIIYSVPAQLIAYGIAVARGTDVDQPRNLAKSVTVE
ncbi:MAG TPA: glutamine--fructose-6-phosphate transaminase (isomerizing), partial [Rhodobacteraceae bacterium]|nr:glutamine--fructose-6-phosphate transaminase (isomerizing) [Paracoccaceae bacterium]